MSPAFDPDVSAPSAVPLSRRAAGRLGAEAVLGAALAGLLHGRGLADDRGAEELDGWFAEYLDLGRGLAEGRLGQLDWLAGTGRLYRGLDLAALRRRVDFDRLSEELDAQAARTGKGEIFHAIYHDGGPPRPGAEPRRAVITKVARVAKGRSVPPHGHGNMVSAFLHLSGEFHVRQFDKLHAGPDRMVVRPTADVRGGAGLWSGITDVKNNLHWLTAVSDDAFLFTTKVIALDAAKPLHGRINVDVRAGERAPAHGPGAVSVPRITHRRAAELYG